MNGPDKSEPDRQQHETESCESRFTDPFDHASKDPGSDKNAHPAEIHHEVPHVRFGDGQTVCKNERKRGRGPVERSDCDRVNPYQALRGISRTGNHAPDCSTSSFPRDCMLASRGFFARFPEVDASENAYEQAENRGGDSRSVLSPVNENGSNRRTDDCTEARCGGEPTETLCAVSRIA